MDRSFIALLASLALLGCHTDSETPPQEPEVVRPISTALRAQCPGSALGRSLDAVRIAEANTVVDSIHDQQGKLVALFAGPINWSIDGPVYVPWDGKTRAGVNAAPGNYFHFVEFRDSTGLLLRRDSVCMLLGNGT